MTHDRRFAKHVATIATVVSGVLFLISTAAIAADPGVTCATAKHKAAVKKLNDKMKCHDKALKTGEAVDTTCLSKAEDKFDASFAKSDDKGGCVTTGDAAAIEAEIDATLANLLAALPAAAPTTCDLLAPQCLAGQGCYVNATSCTDGNGTCSAAGSGVQGSTCVDEDDCTAGLGCFITGNGSQCLTLCQSTQACPAATFCTPVQNCSAFGACF